MPSLRRRQKSLLFPVIAMKRVSLCKTVPLEKISIASETSKVHPSTQDDEVFASDDLGDLWWIYTLQPFPGSHTHHILRWAMLATVGTSCGVKTSVPRLLKHCWPRISTCLSPGVMATRKVIYVRGTDRRIVSLQWDRREGLYIHDKSACNVPSLTTNRPSIMDNNLVSKSGILDDSQRQIRLSKRVEQKVNVNELK